MSDSDFSITPLPEDPAVLNISGTNLGSGQSLTGPSGVSTMAELQKLSPALYKAILQSMAWQICSDSNDSVQRLQQILQENEDNDS